MKVILPEEILRLNCPGFGEQSFLSSGKAKSLDAYKAIFVNPLSILHLFDRDADTLKAVESAQAEGLTAFSLPSDDLVNALNDDITVRTEELVKFLENGGLLVYFLCRPFVLQGSSFALDNYVWLLSLAPVKSSDKNIRQMSTVATGRNIEPCPEAAGSEFADYLSQEGLEWNTIIRAEFLTEGYTPLATAGLKKCIAGELYAGDNGGRIVFLPAPYSPDFDRTLIQCANIWYQKKEGLTPDRNAIAQAVANLLSPPRPEQKPALLKPTSSSSLDSAPALGKAATTSTSGNGATKPGQPATPAKPVATTSGANVPNVGAKAGTPLQRAATTSSTANPAVPAGAAVKSGASGAGSSTAGKPANAPQPGSIQARAAQAAAKQQTAGGVTSKQAAPLERKPAAGSQPVAEPTKKQTANKDITITSDYANPALEQGAPAAAQEEQYDFSEQSQVESPPPQEESAATTSITKQAQPLTQEEKVATTSRAESLIKELAAASSTDLPRVPPQAVRNDSGTFQRKQEAAPKKPAEPGAISGEWYTNYSIAGLEELRRERASLIDQLKQMQARMLTVENRVTTLNHMKNTLLAGGAEFLDCCVKAMGSLGWSARPSPTEKDEIWLSLADKPEALARVIRTAQQPTRSDLAQLAESIITFWGDHEVEPKGIMIACAWADTPFSERSEPAFPDALIEFAKKKNICLLTTMQILCAYRDVEFSKASAENLRKSILATSGALDGLGLDLIKVNRG